MKTTILLASIAILGFSLPVHAEGGMIQLTTDLVAPNGETLYRGTRKGLVREIESGFIVNMNGAEWLIPRGKAALVDVKATPAPQVLGPSFLELETRSKLRMAEVIRRSDESTAAQQKADEASGVAQARRDAWARAESERSAQAAQQRQQQQLNEIQSQLQRLQNR